MADSSRSSVRRLRVRRVRCSSRRARVLVQSDDELARIVLKYGQRPQEAPSPACAVAAVPAAASTSGTHELPKVMNGMGIRSSSTSRGVMTNKRCRAASRSVASCCVRFGDDDATAARHRQRSRASASARCVPKGVEVRSTAAAVTVKGPKGALRASCRRSSPSRRKAKSSSSSSTPNAGVEGQKFQGLTRALVATWCRASSAGFAHRSTCYGVGYRAELKGKRAHLALGLSHQVKYPLPAASTRASRSSTKAAPSGRAFTSTPVTRNARPDGRAHPLVPSAGTLQGQGRALHGREDQEKAGKAGKTGAKGK